MNLDHQYETVYDVLSLSNYWFGAAGWTPVIGDWNGDGKDEIGINKGYEWYLDYDGNGAYNPSIDKHYWFGAAGWTPVIGTWQ